MERELQAIKDLASDNPNIHAIFLKTTNKAERANQCKKLISDIITQKPESKICFINAGDIGTDFISKYGDSDYLIVDSLENLSPKEKVQREFVKAYNKMFKTCRAILITSAFAPKEHENVEDYIVARLSWMCFVEM